MEKKSLSRVWLGPVTWLRPDPDPPCFLLPRLGPTLELCQAGPHVHLSVLCPGAG